MCCATYIPTHGCKCICVHTHSKEGDQCVLIPAAQTAEAEDTPDTSKANGKGSVSRVGQSVVNSPKHLKYLVMKEGPDLPKGRDR